MFGLLGSRFVPALTQRERLCSPVAAQRLATLDARKSRETGCASPPRRYDAALRMPRFSRVYVLALIAIFLGVHLVVNRATAGGEPPVGSGLVPAPPGVAEHVKLAVFARGLESPVCLTFAPGDKAGRLFAVEKAGRVRILSPKGEVQPKPFLDMVPRISKRHLEQGLLALAFHPRYAENGRLYVYFNDPKGEERLVEMHVAKDDPDRVDPAGERELLHQTKPFLNHNGGGLAFGPDGRLYLGLGDGGSGGDPFGNAQNPKSLLGKMLRFDVDGAEAKPEVLETGLRNPWRFAFDRKTGDLYIADVGQDLYEEVDVVPAAAVASGGQNFGWNVTEGFHCYKPRRDCDKTGITPPVLEYGHREGCSITGGFVYRGKEIPELDGLYFYADYCTGLLRSFRYKEGAAADSWDWKAALDPEQRLATISSFGEDAAGELYILSLDGPIYRFKRDTVVR